MRALAFLTAAPIFAVAALAFASCDTGGEPPELDSGFEAGQGDVNDARVNEEDTQATETGDESDVDEACGILGNPCCATGTPCTDGTCTKIGDGGRCEPANCGGPGHPCCFPPESPCNAGATCSDIDAGGEGICSPCGGPGDSCCPLNTCGGGGCCVGGTCVGAGNTCLGADGGMCTGGSCTSCGGPSQACCSTGCTAAETFCAGGSAGVDAGDGDGGGGGGGTSGSPGTCRSCGGPGLACCAGSMCEGSLKCMSDLCVCTTASCGDAAAD